MTTGETEHQLPAIVTTPMVEPPGFWLRFGRAAWGLFRRGGQEVAAVYRVVHPDARLHLAHMPLMGFTFLVPRHCDVVPLADDGHRPLVFVHGLGGHRGNFLAMQSWFRYHGRARSYAISFPDDSSIDVMGRHLSELIERMVAVNDLDGDAQVDIIAHSMGGIISRVALEDPRTARRVHTLVTLATPHAGTLAARYADTVHTRELHPDSRLIQRLSDQVPWVASTRLVTLWSRTDVILLPADTGAVQGAENHEMPGFSHFSYLMERKSWRLVREALER